MAQTFVGEGIATEVLRSEGFYAFLVVVLLVGIGVIMYFFLRHLSKREAEHRLERTEAREEFRKERVEAREEFRRTLRETLQEEKAEKVAIMADAAAEHQQMMKLFAEFRDRIRCTLDRDAHH